MLRLVVALLQVFFASVVLAQAPGPIGGIPPADELPPDWRAYMEAARVAEPEERIRRLEGVVAAHPDTPGMLASRQAILETTAQHWPNRTDEIMKLARSFVGAAPPSARVFAADAAAQALLDAGVLLPEAEKLSLAVLADLGEAGSDEPDELARRAPYVATLGRILAAQGRTEEAEKLLKQAWATNQKVVVAALALAELGEAQGNDDTALGYLMAARLTGRDPAKTAPPLEALYRRLHGGSQEGLEETLDLEYRQRYPNPIETSRWAPTDGPTGRAVLLEVFTGTGCSPCIAMNLSVEAAMRRFGRENLSIVSFHRHIPVVDPFSNAMAEARAAEYDLITIPAVAVDGRVIRGGGMKDDTSRYWSYLSKSIEERLTRPPEAEIALDAIRDGSKIDVRLAARLSGGTGRRLKLGVALVERTSYSGESGIRFHPAVARDLVVGDLPDDESPFRYVFDLQELTASLTEQREALEAQGITYPSVRDAINPERVRVVAFVQDPETRAVLQSRAMRPREGAAAVEKADEAAAPER